MINGFYQYIYNTLLLNQKKGLVRRFIHEVLRFVEQWILMKGSPLVRYNLKGVTIVIPWTHSLPKILRDIPRYSHNTARIGKYVLEKYQMLSFIDVGANIGDTAIMQRNEAYYPILCIEGDREYFELLKNNIKGMSEIEILNTYVGDYDENISMVMNKYLGTGNLKQVGDDGVMIKMLRIDTILKNYPKFQNSKMIKVDTDGYDLKILRGSNYLLEKSRPIVYFEYDPFFIAQQNENGVLFFSWLKEMKYKSIIIYDNFGDLLLTTTVDSRRELEDIHTYYSYRRASAYCDICAFHSEDQDLFEAIRTKERTLYNSLSK